MTPERRIAEELAKAIARHRAGIDHSPEERVIDDGHLYAALRWAQGFEFDTSPPLDLGD